ncbi:hypothetical protein SCB71_09835 [Herbiconiux sp. KACC 21604]|uniref:hypothetical protein n=1 Tax=unclassified Herbiconiux TaxID=2618217 RepID=UPI0014927F03|nr:hypothetical protein [Herbiconiux sp. SALV-R1]QJU53540.1 hypothetical protein HL652_07790 [Herbiconiux sp. SALV-R1]WPO88520.1 hypothetical protein SCB71_09835 [Herbiconiux sp. KACC 21604]
MISLGLEPAAEECSRAGCRASASWRIEWRNPKIHDESRRKVWLACDEHVEFLREFLGARDFPLEVLAVGAPASAPASAPAEGTP